MTLLRQRSFAALFAGQAISRVGDGLHEVALLWLILQITGSALVAGTVLAVRLLPTVLFGLIAGALVDRWNRRRILIVTDLVRAGCVLMIPLLNTVGALSLWSLYAITFAVAVASQLFRPALGASLPNVVPPARLMAANGLMGVTRHVGGFIGPAIGGLVVAWFGLNAVFYIDAGTYLVSAAALLGVAIPARRSAVNLTASDVWADIRDGIAFLRTRSAVLILTLLGIGAHVYRAALLVTLAVFAERAFHQSATIFGFLLSSMNAGMLVGALLVGLLGRFHRVRLIIAGYAAVAAGSAALALSASPGGAMAVLLVTGALSMLSVVPLFTLLQDLVPDEFRGRVLAMDETLQHAVLPALYAAAGWFTDLWGPRATFGAVAAVMALIALLGIVARPLRGAR